MAIPQYKPSEWTKNGHENATNLLAVNPADALTCLTLPPHKRGCVIVLRASETMTLERFMASWSSGTIPLGCGSSVVFRVLNKG